MPPSPGLKPGQFIVNGQLFQSVVLVDPSTGLPTGSSSNPLETTGSGGGGGGFADLLYTDDSGTQFFYRDDGSTPPVLVAYKVSDGSVYTPSTNPVPFSVKNVIIGGPFGQQTSEDSLPVAIAEDQFPLHVLPAPGEHFSDSLASTSTQFQVSCNPFLGALVVGSGTYTGATLQVTGSESSGGSPAFPLLGRLMSVIGNFEGAYSPADNSTFAFLVPLSALSFFQLQLSALGSGTLALTVDLLSFPIDLGYKTDAPGNILVSVANTSPSSDVTVNTINKDVKSSAGNLLSIFCQNISSAGAYLQLWDGAPGSGTFIDEGIIPMGTGSINSPTALALGGADWGPTGKRFSNSIQWGLSSTAQTYTALGSATGFQVSSTYI